MTHAVLPKHVSQPCLISVKNDANPDMCVVKVHGLIHSRKEHTVIVSHNTGNHCYCYDADANLMQNPAKFSVRSIYGNNEALSSLKMVTLVPELGNSQELIPHVTQRGIVVSLGQTTI